MKILKKKLFIYFIAFLICGVFAFLIYTIVSNKNDKKNNETDEVAALDTHLDQDIKLDYKVLGVEINGVMYNAFLEENDIALEFFLMTPFDIVMDDYNGNQKLYYLGDIIDGELDYIGSVKKGDIMLYNNDSIVICYKDFEVDSDYAKIGHIDNFPNLDGNRLEIKFIR